MKWWRRWTRLRDCAAAEAQRAAAAQREDDMEQTKAELRQRLHDANARLHVLEWQADVKGRAFDPSKDGT